MTLNDKLQQAETAYHRLQTGTMAVSITEDGQQIDFNRANIHQLKNYIDELKLQLGMKSTRRKGPAGVMF
ncbi:gpW family protein [Shewanella surugensis]|uniref:GpW family protein n=1 Tax=Shewanella surugensis TaxID=212020 RepID=A0ABT0L9W6_9GAMM|nr:gpW family protein [Shewanella surugensis]MCL1124150.1 gpW family protein [Shewanella surugensis]